MSLQFQGCLVEGFVQLTVINSKGQVFRKRFQPFKVILIQFLVGTHNHDTNYFIFYHQR